MQAELQKANVRHGSLDPYQSPGPLLAMALSSRDHFLLWQVMRELEEAELAMVDARRKLLEMKQQQTLAELFIQVAILGSGRVVRGGCGSATSRSTAHPPPPMATTRHTLAYAAAAGGE